MRGFPLSTMYKLSRARLSTINLVHWLTLRVTNRSSLLAIKIALVATMN